MERQEQKRQRRRLWLALLFLLLALGLNGLRPQSASDRAPDNWQWITCDVGQGDAHLIRTGKTGAILLDTGQELAPLRGCLGWAGVDHLEAVMITHQHRDHYGALEELAASMPVDRVLTTHHFEPGKIPSHLPVTLLAAEPANPPPELSLGGQVHAQVLWPPADKRMIPGRDGSSVFTNNTSLVLRFSLGEEDPLTVLTTGDIEEEAAIQLIRTRAQFLPSAVLKVAHHGSAGSGTDLIGVSAPNLALIPVGGGNEYGHPHSEITAYLETAGIPLYRTDRKGHIALSREAENVRVTVSGG